MKGDFVVFNNVSYKYRGSNNWILKDINLSIEYGDRFGLIGDNGSGKSTLAKLLAGVMYPNKGEVLYMNKPITWNRSYPRISYVGDPGYDQYTLGLPFGLTVNSIIESFLNLLPSIDNETVKILKEGFRLNEFAGVKIENLSKGQRQKVMAFLALVKPFDLLIADEPTEGMDKCSSDFFLSYINEKIIIEKQPAIIWISHRWDEVFAICQRVYELDNGRAIQFEDQKIFNFCIGKNSRNSIELDLPKLAIIQKTNKEIQEFESGCVTFTIKEKDS